MAFLAKYCRSYIGLGTLLGILIQFLNYYTYFLKFFFPLFSPGNLKNSFNYFGMLWEGRR